MERERKIIATKKVNGIRTSTVVSSDPFERLEEQYINTYGQLPFTSHIELEEYISKFEEQNRRVKTKLKNYERVKRLRFRTWQCFSESVRTDILK